MIEFSEPNRPAGRENRIFVSLVHPDRCEHENVDSQPEDLSVGFYGYEVCEDCGAELERDAPEPWDDGDRAYDAWKDSLYDR